MLDLASTMSGPRKAHTKSRRGCIECKRRHTKCDEQHPRCSTCTRIQVECTWPKPPKRPASSPASEVSTPDVLSSFNNISKSLGDCIPRAEHLAIDDLKLLHHFTTKTYATLSNVVSQQDIWRESVIQIGFRHPFLLRGVLAIAALHLATLNPDLSADFLIQASTQYNRALLDFRNALCNVDAENCASVFVFACITVIHAFAVAQIQKPHDPIADLLNCMRLVQGVKTVLEPQWETLMTTELRPLLQNSAQGGIPGEVPEISKLKTLVNSLPDNEHGTTANAYIHAVDLLHTVALEAKTSGVTQSYLALLFTWPALLPPEFLSSLSIQEPVSVIIVAHFVAILGSNGDSWWISCWDKYIISAVESILATDLLEWLLWPKQISNMHDVDENQQLHSS